jgi:hypothetical protein
MKDVVVVAAATAVTTLVSVDRTATADVVDAPVEHR